MLQTLIHGLFPIECVVCRTEGTWLCHTHQALPPAPPNQAIFKHLDQIYAATAYSDPVVKKIITYFKFRRFRPLASVIATQIYHQAPAHLWLDAVVIPIPLHWQRRWWRGFNQANLIARQLQRINLQINIQKHILKRVKKTQQQARLNASHRDLNLKNAFITTNKIKNKKVILLDDVVASGQTLDAAARTLKKAGATEVIGVVFARGG